MVVLRNYVTAEQPADLERLAPTSSADEPLTRRRRLPGLAVLAAIAVVQLTWVAVLGYATWWILS